MTTDEERAERMFPTMKPGAEQPLGPPDQRTSGSLAGRLYPSVDDNDRPAESNRVASDDVPADQQKRLEKMFPSVKEEPENPGTRPSEPGTDTDNKAVAPADAQVVTEEDLADIMQADPETPTVAQVAEVMSELNLDKQAAGRLVNLEAEQRTAYWEQQAETWQTEVLSEPNADQTVADAIYVVDRFGDPDFKKSIGPYGNHPGLIRLLARVRQELER